MPSKKKLTKTIDVSGMSISDIINIDLETFNKMGEKDLRAVTSRLVSASNKRIRRFENKGIISPAYRSLGTDTRFSTKVAKGVSKGQRLNKIRQEFSRARNFLNLKTSTMTGYNEYVEEIKQGIEEQTGMSMKGVDIKKLYETLHQAQERGDVSAVRGSKGSLQAREIIVNMMKDNNLTPEQYMTKLQEEYTRYYENPEEYEYEEETEESIIPF